MNIIKFREYSSRQAMLTLRLLRSRYTRIKSSSNILETSLRSLETDFKHPALDAKQLQYLVSITPASQWIPRSPIPGKTRFQNHGKKSISSIVGGYKSAVTNNANRFGFANGWQSRFHNHIIRDDEEYQRISDYIVNNPKN